MPPLACRACLTTGPKLYDMYTNNLHEIFGEVLGNPIFELDDLPQHICGVCYTQLMKFEEFRNRCCRVQDILEGALQKGIKLTTAFIGQIDRRHHKLLINLKKVKSHVDLIIQEQLKADPPEEKDQVNEDETEDNELFRLVPIPQPKPLQQLVSLKQSLQPLQQNKSASLPKKNELPVRAMHIDDFLKTIAPNISEPDLPVVSTDIYTLPEQSSKLTPPNPTSSNIYHPDASKIRKPPPQKKIMKIQNKTNKKSKYLSKFEDTEHLEKFSQKYNLNIVYLTKEQQIEELQEKIRQNAGKNVLFCADCGKTFMKNENLETHIKQFHDESAGSAVCDICKYRCPAEKINNHLRTHSLRVACNQCDFITTSFKNSFTDVIHHAISHQANPTKNFPCKHCESVFEKKCLLNSHITENHPNELFWCKCCGETFISNKSVRYHLSILHGEILKSPHQCQQCGLRFPTNEVLIKHSSLTCEDFNCLMCGIHVESNLLLKHHVVQQHSRCMYIKLAKCMECGVKFYGTKPLAKHLDGNYCGKGVPCLECGISCPTAESLEDHQAISHSTQEYRTCDRCDKVFNKFNYRKHFARVHNSKPPQIIRRRRNPTRVWSVQGSIISIIGPKPESKAPRYMCDACGKGCQSPYALNLHKRLHTSEKPFTCDVCLQAFRLKTQLVEHMYLHTGEKPNKCPHCPKAFRRSKVLQEHLVRHTGVRRHICNLCSKAFATSTSVKEHIRCVHLHQPSRRNKRAKVTATRNTDTRNTDTYDYIDTVRNTCVKIVNIRKPGPLRKKPRNDTSIIHHDDILTQDVNVMDMTQVSINNDTHEHVYDTHSRDSVGGSRTKSMVDLF